MDSQAVEHTTTQQNKKKKLTDFGYTIFWIKISETVHQTQEPRLKRLQTARLSSSALHKMDNYRNETQIRAAEGCGPRKLMRNKYSSPVNIEETGHHFVFIVVAVTQLKAVIKFQYNMSKPILLYRN